MDDNEPRRPMRASGFPWWWLWVPRWMRRAYLRLHRPVNVLAHGADPTGATDSTAAIQAAIATAGKRGNWWPRWLWQPPPVRRITSAQRTTYLPAGSYKVHSVHGYGVSRTALDLSAGVTLRGEGQSGAANCEDQP